MAAKRKGQHNSDKEQYGAYKAQARYSKNKRAKLERHLKKYPEDAQAAEALKNVSPEPRRKTPKTYMWSKTQIKQAEMLARVGLNGNAVLNKKYAELHKDEIIGYGAPHALDDVPKKKKGKGTKGERKGV